MLDSEPRSLRFLAKNYFSKAPSDIEKFPENLIHIGTLYPEGYDNAPQLERLISDPDGWPSTFEVWILPSQANTYSLVVMSDFIKGIENQVLPIVEKYVKLQREEEDLVFPF